MSDAFLEHPLVRHVAACFAAAGHPHAVIALADAARSAAEAAAVLGVEVGAIVKTLMFVAGRDEMPVIALVAGDRQCDVAALAACVGACDPCRRPDAARVKAVTGYSIGGVSPIGLAAELPVFLDGSLFRFESVWSAAGASALCISGQPVSTPCPCTGNAR